MEQTDLPEPISGGVRDIVCGWLACNLLHQQHHLASSTNKSFKIKPTIIQNNLHKHHKYMHIIDLTDTYTDNMDQILNIPTCLLKEQCSCRFSGNTGSHAISVAKMLCSISFNA